MQRTSFIEEIHASAEDFLMRVQPSTCRRERECEAMVFGLRAGEPDPSARYTSAGRLSEASSQSQTFGARCFLRTGVG